MDSAMARFSNNRTKAAHAIGISVRTLQRKLTQREAPSVVLFRTESN
ncbi:MAG: helix-turn-helix domain-containing protein [Phycisphaerae bacterium]